MVEVEDSLSSRCVHSVTQWACGGIINSDSLVLSSCLRGNVNWNSKSTSVYIDYNLLLILKHDMMPSMNYEA